MNRSLVIVTWRDAVMHSDGDSKAKHVPVVQVTIGWLLHYDMTGISIMCEYSKDSPNEWRSENFIPNGMIVEVQKIPNPRKKILLEPAPWES